MKSIFEQYGGTYTKVGDYYLPNISLPETSKYQIRKYGNLRKSFLKEHHKSYYTILFMEGKLFEHLAEIDKTCNDFMDMMLPKMMKQEGVTEELKAKDQMEWVRKVNSIKHRIEEIIYNDYIYGGFER